MAYCITNFSILPIYQPFLDFFNDDGSAFTYLEPSLPMKVNFRLATGALITDTSYPSFQSFPHNARLTSRHKNLPDIFEAASDLCVSQAVRGDIEALEPNIHQFLPIKMHKKNGDPFGEAYYLLNICQLFDAVILEKSNLRRVFVSKGSNRTYIERGLDPKDFRTVKKVVVSEKHLWRDVLYQKDIYMSDLLYSKLKNNKRKGALAWHSCVVGEE